jgi:hypothetical protein
LTSSLLQGHCNVALGHPTDKHLHNESLQPVTGLREIGPYVGAVRVLHATYLWHLDAQHAFRGLPRAILIPIAIAVGDLAALVSAPPQGLGLLPFSRFLHDSFRRELDQGTQYLLPTTGLCVALQEGHQLLCFHLTRRSPLRHTGGSFFSDGHHSHTRITLPEKGLSSTPTFTGIIGRHPPLWAPGGVPRLVSAGTPTARPALVAPGGPWGQPPRRQDTGPAPTPRCMPRPGRLDAQVGKSRRRQRMVEGKPRVVVGTQAAGGASLGHLRRADQHGG